MGEILKNLNILQRPLILLVSLICPYCSQGLKRDQKYSMKVSTVLNGRTISHISQDIEEHRKKLRDDEVSVEMGENAAN